MIAFLHALKPASRVLLVAAGYLAALLVAAAAVAAFGAGADVSGGMAAFGDALLFLAAFGLAAVPATGAALFFLRSNARFWQAAAIVALGVAATGIGALAAYSSGQEFGAGSALAAWSALSPLRLLVAPLFVLAFFLAAVFSPNRSSRGMLLAAAAGEAAVFLWVAAEWFHAAL